MSSVDFDELEENTHLILYCIVKNYPDVLDKKKIEIATGFHYNTIRSKLPSLLDLKLIKTRKRGNIVLYFVDEQIKSIFDEWTETDIGQKTIVRFQKMLKSEKNNITT